MTAKERTNVLRDFEKRGMAIFLVLGMTVLAGCGLFQRETDESAEDFDVPEESVQKSAPVPQEADGTFRPFAVYADANSPDNHFFPSGWMGDYGDIGLSQESLENPRGGTTCIEVSYSGARSQGAGWAGIYWQNPANNWGSKPGGFDLSGAKKLTFWARGAKGGERIEEFRIGGITGEYPDSDVAGIGPAVLTTEWKQFTIDLDGKDLSYISGGFCWVAKADANPKGAKIYLDDIRYE